MSEREPHVSQPECDSTNSLPPTQQIHNTHMHKHAHSHINTHTCTCLLSSLPPHMSRSQPPAAPLDHGGAGSSKPQGGGGGVCWVMMTTAPFLPLSLSLPLFPSQSTFLMALVGLGFVMGVAPPWPPSSTPTVIQHAVAPTPHTPDITGVQAAAESEVCAP